MGSYTNPQNFYLIDPTELVNVDNDLNYNLQRADTRIRSLVEYVYTDVPSITDSSLTKGTGFKWYKTYTNAIWNARDTTSGVFQDPNAQVDSWSTSDIVFESGYGSTNLQEQRVGYSIFNGWVRWRGRVALTNGNELPANTVTDFLTPPASTQPNKGRYFTVHGGNASGVDFQVFRVFIPAAGSADVRLEFIKYGGNSATSGDRYLSLNDVYYPLNDTAGT
jgi:hypothetical protein